MTYNSSQYVIETLESIRIQNYPNIELVVSDDGSSDNTYSLVFNWIELNKSCFKRAIIVRSFSNRGTCYNYNQGVCNSNGVYVKTIDGDDCLNDSDAISKYILFMEEFHADICISDVELFTNDEMDLTKEREWYDYLFKCVNEDYEAQKRRISTELAIPNPASFFTRKLYDEIGGYSEDYKYLEEWPFFYKIIMSGHQIYGLNDKLVKYRLVKKSVSHNTKSKVFLDLQKDSLRFFVKVRSKSLFRSHKYSLLFMQSLRSIYKYYKTKIKFYI